MSPVRYTLTRSPDGFIVGIEQRPLSAHNSLIDAQRVGELLVKVARERGEDAVFVPLAVVSSTARSAG